MTSARVLIPARKKHDGQGNPGGIPWLPTLVYREHQSRLEGTGRRVSQPASGTYYIFGLRASGQVPRTRRKSMQPSISNSSGPYFHLMLLNALMALALACCLLFSGIDWALLRSHQRFNPIACPRLLSSLSSSSRGHLRTCPSNSLPSPRRIQPALNPISGRRLYANAAAFRRPSKFLFSCFHPPNISLSKQSSHRPIATLF